MAATILYEVPGPCSITWNGLPLGATKTGIVLRSASNWLPLTADRTGSAPIDWVYGGSTVTLECTLLEPAGVAAALPFIGSLYSIADADNNNRVGQLLFNGDAAHASTFGKELVITERAARKSATTTYYWKAKYTVPLEPEELLLAATQELQIPLVFLIAPDENNLLFYSVPDYL